MIRKNFPTVGSGTHVAFDGPGADHLLKLGATNVVCAWSRPTTGPSRLDVQEHIQTQNIWFRSSETLDHLYDENVRWETPVIVWTSPCINDRLNLWRTCSWLRDKGVSHRDILIIDIPPRPPNPDAVPRIEPFDSADSLFYQSKEAIEAHLAAARSWSRERYDNAIMLWEKFVAPDPRPFFWCCRNGVREFHEVGFIWSFFSRLFPRLNPGRVLHLSRYDEILLQALSARWKTPVKVYISDTIQQYWEFFSCVGDLGMANRLAAWAKHDAGAAVERAPGPRPDHPMWSSVYRLTKHGRELHERLSDLADAPRLPVGGAEAYAPEAPWVLRYDGRLARL